jgi:hypothetical protein
MKREREGTSPLLFAHFESMTSRRLQPSDWTTDSVPTHSVCPVEGDRTEGQEQVGASKKMTRQQGTSRFTVFPVGGKEFRTFRAGQ